MLWPCRAKLPMVLVTIQMQNTYCLAVSYICLPQLSTKGQTSPPSVPLHLPAKAEASTGYDVLLERESQRKRDCNPIAMKILELQHTFSSVPYRPLYLSFVIVFRKRFFSALYYPTYCSLSR